MDAVVFVQELDAFKTERFSPIVGPSQTSLLGGVAGDAKTMLQLPLRGAALLSGGVLSG